MVAEVFLVEVLQAQLDCDEASRSGFLLLSCLLHPGHSWIVYLLQLRKFISQQASNQKCFVNEVAESLDRDEFVFF